MNVHLDPKTKEELEALAQAEGKNPEVKLRELVHAAHEARTRNGEPLRKPVPPELSLSGLAGVGKELWAGEDAQEYVSRLRSEWE